MEKPKPSEIEPFIASEVALSVKEEIQKYILKIIDGIVCERPLYKVKEAFTKIKLDVTDLPNSVVPGSSDGGSAIFNLRSSCFGVCVSCSILVDRDNKIHRSEALVSKIPEDPLSSFNITREDVEAMLAPLREALVVMSALKMLKDGIDSVKPDILIVDGPLIPPARIWLKKRRERIGDPVRLYLEYRRRMLDYAEKIGVTVVGFVKRPKSHYISQIYGLKSYPDVALSTLAGLGWGESYPWPPIELGGVELSSIIHDDTARKSIVPGRLSFTFLKTSRGKAPYRVDISRVFPPFTGVKQVLSYILSLSDLDGIPFPVVKADETVKITKRFARDTYRSTINHVVSMYAGEEDKLKLLLELLGWMHGET